MAGFFSRAPQNVTQTDIYEHRYSRARFSLLTAVILTVLNIILLVSGTNTYFFFSAFIPYLIADLGMALCGKYPEDYYTEELADIEFLDPSFLVIAVVIALCIAGIYLLCFFMSKKNNGIWLTVALIMFAIDTLSMMTGIMLAAEFLIDVAFHLWLIVDLALGLNAYTKLKALRSTEQLQTPQTDEDIYFAGENDYDPLQAESNESENQTSSAFAIPDSPILREADMTVKHRVLLQATAGDLYICYRRVKSVNELVINGNVYAEKKGIVEFAHRLCANYNGHAVEAGFDGSFSYIALDGQLIERKLRLI